MAVPTISYGEGMPGRLPAQPMIPVGLAQEFAGGAFAAAAKLTQFAADFALREQDAREATQIAELKAKTISDFDDFRIKLDSDTDYAGREDKFKAFADQRRTEAIGELGSPRARRKFEEDFPRIAGTYQVQVRHDRRDAELQQSRAALDTSVNGVLTKALTARSPAERDMLLGEADKMIDEARATGTVSAIKAAELKRNKIMRFQSLEVQDMIISNPSAAVAALNDPEQFKFLPAEERMRLKLVAKQRGESVSVQAKADARAEAHDLIEAEKTGVQIDPAVRAATRKKVAGVLGPTALSIFDRQTDYWGNVNGARTLPLPELRSKIIEREATGQPADINIAHGQRRVLAGRERELAGEVAEDYKEAQKVWASGNEYADSARLVKKVLELSGPQGVEALQMHRDFLFDKARIATEAPSELAGRLKWLEAMRKGEGTLTLEQVEMGHAALTALKTKSEQVAHDPAGAVLKYWPTIEQDRQTTVRAIDALAPQAGDPRGTPRLPDGRTTQDLQVEMRSHNAALMAAQAREGVPVSQMNLLPKSQATLVEAMLKDANGDARMNALTYIDTLAGGSEEHRNMILRQLDAAGVKLTPDMTVLMALPAEGRERAAPIIMDAYKQDVKALTAAVGGDKAVNELNKVVNAWGASERKAFEGYSGGAAFWGANKEVIQRVALSYKARGYSDGEAVKLASGVVFSQWHEVVGSTLVRKVGGIPIAAPADVQGAQRFIANTIDKLDIEPPPRSPADAHLTPAAWAAQYKENLKATLKFPAAPDGKGFYVKDVLNETVRHRLPDGRVVELYMPFDPASSDGLRPAYRAAKGTAIDDATPYGAAPTPPEPWGRPPPPAPVSPYSLSPRRGEPLPAGTTPPRPGPVPLPPRLRPSGS